MFNIKSFSLKKSSREALAPYYIIGIWFMMVLFNLPPDSNSSAIKNPKKLMKRMIFFK